MDPEESHTACTNSQVSSTAATLGTNAVAYDGSGTSEGPPPLEPSSTGADMKSEASHHFGAVAASSVTSPGASLTAMPATLGLAESAGFLHPTGSLSILKEHLHHLLHRIDREETLVAVIRMVEAELHSGIIHPGREGGETSGTAEAVGSRSSLSTPGLWTGVTPISLMEPVQVGRPSDRPCLGGGGEDQVSPIGRCRSTTSVSSSFSPADSDSAGHASTPHRTPPAKYALPPYGALSPASDTPQPSSPSTADPTSSEMSTLPPMWQQGGRRVAVSAAPFSLDEVQQYTPRVVPKTPSEERQVRQCVKNCHLFANMDSEAQDIIVQSLNKEVVAAGTAVLEQGCEPKEKLFLMAEGTCEAIKNGKSLGTIYSGGTFGELELMYKQATCAATIRCVTRCVLYTLDEEAYHHIVMNVSLQKRRTYEQLLMNVGFLKFISDYDRTRLAEALVTKEFAQGEQILQFGTKGNYMHLIEKGEVKVVGRRKGKKVEVVRLHRGDVVGELEFLFGHLAVADVVAVSPRVVTARISRSHFELLIGSLQDHLKAFVAASPTYERYYLADIADASVRSELSRVGSARHTTRVASAEPSAVLDAVDHAGEMVIAVPKTLICGATMGTDLDDPATQVGGPATDGVLQDTRQLPSPHLYRFPLSQLCLMDIVLLGIREDGLILCWNEALVRLTGYTAKEAVGQTIYSFLREESEQEVLLHAVADARRYAGNVGGFLADPSVLREQRFTIARSDGLTNANIQLTVIPPIVSAGNGAANMLLGVGGEVQESPQKGLDQTQWLVEQLRAILANEHETPEDRLHGIAELANNAQAIFCAMTMSTDRLRIVHVRQMLGQVVMDCGSDCVQKGVSVRQRFEGLPSERAYLDAGRLPQCLRYAMTLCMLTDCSQLTITTTITEKNGIEFLIINFNVDGRGFPSDCVRLLEDPSWEPPTDDVGEEGGDKEDLRKVQHQLRRVQTSIERQGGTMKMQRNLDDANLAFFIPFMAADGLDEDAGTSTRGTATNNRWAEGTVSPMSTNGHHGGTSPQDERMNVTDADQVDSALNTGEMATSSLRMTRAVKGECGRAPMSSLGLPTVPPSSTMAPPPAYNFTTIVAEDTPAHRNMLCSFLWDRKHAVLPAYHFADVERLSGVVDILLIDLHQSVLRETASQDPIALLRKTSRQMAVVVTSTTFDDASTDAYHTAGFITLRKPCTPVQAMRAICLAEQQIAQRKQEAERIAQTRETLAKNSRGAWKRGRLLGKGAFGEVYEAIDVLTGGTMAVKEMRLGKRNMRIEQFVEEIAVMCNLQHPNIIHYFYCEESPSEDVVRVFMEYAAGGSLQELLARKGGGLPFPEYQALLRDLTEGIAYIHSQKYVHGDIKTANVLLSHEGKGKMGDFGTARVVQEGQLLYEMQGSPLYMSPECMSAGELDEEGQRIGYSFPSDIWSLGCIALEMATNRPPFSHIHNVGGPAGLTRYLTSLTDTPDLSPLFDSPPCIIEFVSACLNPDPARRATASELLQFSIFTEAPDEDTKSALRALQRAQLLHVLQQYVAFQEPEPDDVAGEDLLGTHRHGLSRSLVNSFFDSTSTSGNGSRSSSPLAIDPMGASAGEDGDACILKQRSLAGRQEQAGDAVGGRRGCLKYTPSDEGQSPNHRSITQSNRREDSVPSLGATSLHPGGDGRRSATPSGSADVRAPGYAWTADRIGTTRQEKSLGGLLLHPTAHAAGGTLRTVGGSSTVFTTTSILNFSFTRNASFLGANRDETLHSAANDFLSTLSRVGGGPAPPSPVIGPAPPLISPGVLELSQPNLSTASFSQAPAGGRVSSAAQTPHGPRGRGRAGASGKPVFVVEELNHPLLATGGSITRNAGMPISSPGLPTAAKGGTPSTVLELEDVCSDKVNTIQSVVADGKGQGFPRRRGALVAPAPASDLSRPVVTDTTRAATHHVASNGSSTRHFLHTLGTRSGARTALAASSGTGSSQWDQSLSGSRAHSVPPPEVHWCTPAAGVQEAVATDAPRDPISSVESSGAFLLPVHSHSSSSPLHSATLSLSQPSRVNLQVAALSHYWPPQQCSALLEVCASLLDIAGQLQQVASANSAPYSCRSSPLPSLWAEPNVDEDVGKSSLTHHVTPTSQSIRLVQAFMAPQTTLPAHSSSVGSGPASAATPTGSCSDGEEPQATDAGDRAAATSHVEGQCNPRGQVEERWEPNEPETLRQTRHGTKYQWRDSSSPLMPPDDLCKKPLDSSVEGEHPSHRDPAKLLARSLRGNRRSTRQQSPARHREEVEQQAETCLQALRSLTQMLAHHVASLKDMPTFIEHTAQKGPVPL